MTERGGAFPVDLTVNEAIRRWPGAVSVFKLFRIHTCCGGAEPILAAAERDGADPEALLEALERVMLEDDRPR